MLTLVHEHDSYTIEDSKSYFRLEGRGFLLDGKPFVVRSGDALSRSSQHGVTVSRKQSDGFEHHRPIFWNLHERTVGDFGNLDVAEFVREAGQESFMSSSVQYIFVRNGNLGIRHGSKNARPARSPRTNALSKPRENMLQRSEAAPASRSPWGNIIMTQVENEYGCSANTTNTSPPSKMIEDGLILLLRRTARNDANRWNAAGHALGHISSGRRYHQFEFCQFRKTSPE